MNVNEVLAGLIARLNEWIRGHEREHALMDKALEKAEGVQSDVDHKLNNVRTRFVDKDHYDEDMEKLRAQRIEDQKVLSQERNSLNAKITGLLISVVLLLIGVIVSVALRGT